MGTFYGNPLWTLPPSASKFPFGTLAAPSNPPPKPTAALLALISTWPSGYDPTPYQEAQSAQAEIASYTPSTGPITPVNNPPFALRVPLSYRRPGGVFYADEGLYGFSYTAGAASAAAPSPVNNPPFARRIPVTAKEPGRFYSDGSQYGFTYSSGGNVPAPPVIVNNPPLNQIQQEIAAAVRAAWPQDAWPAQRASANLVQPYAGDEPPGCPMPPTWEDFPPLTWRVQSAPPVAGMLQIPVINNPPPPVPENLQAIRASWGPDQWPAQTRGPALAALAQTYGDQPPPRTNAGLYEIRATWLEITWDAQGAVRKILPVLIVPAPFRDQRGLQVRNLWPVDAWAAQSAHNPVAPLTLAYGDEPPRTSRAAFYARRQAWPEADWRASRAALGAPVAVAPPRFAPPYSIASRVAIRATWTEASWAVQSAVTHRAIPKTRDMPFPGHPRQQPSGWDAMSWGAQGARRGIAAFTPPTADPPPRYSTLQAQLIVHAWTPGPPLPPRTSGLGNNIIPTLEFDPDWSICVPADAFLAVWEPPDRSCCKDG